MKDSLNEIGFIVSAEGERVKITSIRPGTESVEIWMNKLQANMLTAVGKFIKEALTERERDEDNKFRLEWIKSQFSQAVCVVSSISWCSYTELMLTEPNPLENMLYWYEENINMLEQLTTLVRNPKLTQIQR